MDRPSKILLSILVLLVAGSIAASYYRFVVKRDYIIEAQTDCDPYTETCFVWECDPKTEGECTGNPEEDIWYYKLLRRNAMHIPECDPSEEGCEALVCPEGEAECEEILCSEDVLAEREEEGVCTDPEEYAAENPLEEVEEDEMSSEEGSSEEGDEEEPEEGASEESDETVSDDATPPSDDPASDPGEPEAMSGETTTPTAEAAPVSPSSTGRVVELLVNGKTLTVTLPEGE